MKEILSAHEITKSYSQEKRALQDVSFKLKKGEILAILGKSGSGKTTLIKVLAGLLDADDGYVLFQGEKLKGPNDKLVPGHEEIRLVHQDFKLYHGMRVEENLKNALIEYVHEYQVERTAELLALCGLEPVRDKYVHELSGGEKQRVAIAMALSTEPEVLLFDEPFSNLDFGTKARLLHEVQEIARQTKTAIILITHDSRDAMEIADRMIVLHQGKILREGTPPEVYEAPGYEAVANLFGLYNQLNADALNLLSKDTNAACGLWAEDVLLHKANGIQGRVRKVVFSGMTNKILISAKGFDLWAYDHSKKVKEKDKVKFTVRAERIFVCK